MTQTEQTSASIRDRVIGSLMGCTLTKEDVSRIAEVIWQCVPPDSAQSAVDSIFAQARMSVWDELRLR